MLSFKQIQEMAYPSSFDMTHFKSIPSFRGRLEYANTHLKKLGSGSARTIFQIDNEKVLKLAKNKKGIAQNEVESDFYLQHYDCVARVYDREENNQWIEMELPKKVSSKRFKQLLRFSVDDVWNYLYNLKIKYNLKGKNRYDVMRDIPNIEELEESNFIQELQDMVLSFDLMVPGDFGRESTYGEVIRNGEPTIVIIDFGLTNTVYDDFYKRV